MKKLISLGLAAVMLMSAGSALAEEYNTPSLIYNNKQIADEETGLYITEGRTMLPFRYILEEIGANVDYDDAQRMVKAEKDGIEIAFSLDDTYIDITKDGNTGRVIQDVSNEIKEDRVYVPVRFMSEAFDLNVGWDAWEKTAIIVDIPQYMRELEEAAPDFKRYTQIVSKLPESYTETVSMTFDLEADAQGLDAKQESVELKFDFDAELSKNGSAMDADTVLSFDTNTIETLTGVGIESLNDVKFTFMYKDGQFYAKTNLIDKLKEIAPDNARVQGAAFLINSNTWFKADIYELFEALGLPAELIPVIKDGFKGGKNNYYSEIASIGFSNGITSVFQANTIDHVFSIYKVIYKDAFTITDNGNGNYDITMNISKDYIVNAINSILAEKDVEDEDLKYFIDLFVFDGTVNIKVENNIAVKSDASVAFEFNDDSTNININLNINSTLTPDTNKDITAPDSALDLVNIIKLLK